ncbi:hypothetical protein MKW92_006246 [Papaver armeniacum]|nr:hypothetical protein MKW92_006246 [Papaver armeniacum]
MELRSWSGTVPKDRLDVLHQLQRIFCNFGGVWKFEITNGQYVDRLLFKCWDHNMIVEIFSNAFFHNFQSNMFMMEYELAEGLSLSKALGELLRPPTADIRFLLIEGSNMLSLFKEVDGFPAVRKDIKLQYGEFMPQTLYGSCCK